MPQRWLAENTLGCSVGTAWRGRTRIDVEHKDEHFDTGEGSFGPQLVRGGFLCQCGLVLLMVGDERDEISTRSERD